MPKNEFFNDFYYPKAHKVSGLALLKRRLSQFGQILFSSRYSSVENLNSSIQDYYSHPKEVEFYKTYASFGLHVNELEALQEIQSNSSIKKILIVGCGAGREAFYIAKKCSQAKVDAIDFSEDMIFQAIKINKRPNLNFYSRSVFEMTGSYDVIWVTSILESHIQGKRNRIQFFHKIKELTHENSKVVFTPQIKKLHPLHHYFWSSQLLKLRWRNQLQWEKGDVLLAHLGAHRRVDKLVYSHFYPSEKHFTKELKQAGFIDFSELDHHSWIVS